MKRIFFILIIILLFTGNAHSNSLPDSIFGIKINDNAGNYVDIKKGIELKDRPGFLNYFETQGIKFNQLVRNDGLEHYYIRTDKKNNQVKVVTGYTTYSDIRKKKNGEYVKKHEGKYTLRDLIEGLSDNYGYCLERKNIYLKNLSNYYSIDKESFKNNFYKKNDSKGNVIFYDSSELYFKKGFFNKFTLQILCTFVRKEKKIYSTLYISLADQDYFNSIKPLWTKIEKLNLDMIKGNLKGF